MEQDFLGLLSIIHNAKSNPEIPLHTRKHSFYCWLADDTPLPGPAA